MSKDHMKNAMRDALNVIGGMGAVSLIVWLAIEMFNYREEVSRGMAWIGAFL